MDHRSWSWRRKSSDKNPREAESSGSMSSHSELYSDDQEVSRASSNLSTQSPEVTSKVVVTNEEVNDKLKSLREKLSAALINISVKDDLVKQHAKVAEEAVSGWEKAGNEAAILKQQLEAAVQKNFALEDRIGHLDGALKECLRKLRQTREEQERKIHEAVLQNTRECDSMKFELEKKLVQLQAQVEASKVEDGTPTHSDLLLKLETAEKQNSALERELLAQVEELEMMALERDLSTETAEIASKQHLESIKKVAKLEAECRKLRAMAHKASLSNDHKSVTSTSVYVESHTDSQSDIGERLLTLDTDNHKLGSLELSGCEPSRSDSWASALIAELDQFKNQKAIAKNFATSTVENDFMDDFLEMERLAALPQLEGGKHGTERGFSSDRHSCQGCQHKADLDAMMERMTELENKLEKVEVEKASLEVTLAESQGQLKTSQNKLTKAKDKLMELHRQLDLANYSKQETEAEMKMVFAKRELVESQLASMDAEVLKLHAKVGSLEAEVKQERALSAQITTKCRELEDGLSTKKREAELLQAATSNVESKLKQERELAVAAGKFAECQKTIASLGRQLKSLATSDDFLVDSKHPLKVNEGSLISRTGELLNSSYNRETVVPI